MVTNPKNNHHPPKPEQTGLRLCKDNSYTPLHLLPYSLSSLSPVSFRSLPCLIPPPPLSYFTLFPISYHPPSLPLTTRKHTPQSPKNKTTAHSEKPAVAKDSKHERAFIIINQLILL